MKRLGSWLAGAMVLLGGSVTNSSAEGRDPALHPLKQELPRAEIDFRLRTSGFESALTLVQCTYRARRDRDVKSERHLHLLDGPWRIGSKDLVTVSREEFHHHRLEVRLEEGEHRFSVPLRDPDPDWARYQLDEVSFGNVSFSRWFETAPELSAGYGLVVEPGALSGTVPLGGLGAEPLRGALPLWPELRTVTLTLREPTAPEITVWDGLTRHDWDGWRQSVPEQWKGGDTVVARHISSPVVYVRHTYDVVLPGWGAKPPDGIAPAMPGVQLEVYWPDESVLYFPEVRLGGQVNVTGVPLARWTDAQRDLLREASLRRPGVEPWTLSTRQGEALLAVPDLADEAASFAIEPDSTGAERLVVWRGALTEDWIYLLTSGVPEEERIVVYGVLLHPEPWSGPLPE
ncbi:MAG: hypothetical protein IPK72_10485 [Candidatus Eisenbacteria bacterium]|nr:hypothetical protein [Candidatus Eisenbacteria bacterium]